MQALKFRFVSELNSHYAMRASALVLLTVLAFPVNAGIIKSYVIYGSAEGCEQDICNDFLLTGSLVYDDPNPDADDLLQLNDVISLELELRSFENPSFLLSSLVIPYISPPGGPFPSLELQEIGRAIRVDMRAYSDFLCYDFSTGECYDANEWLISPNGRFSWANSSNRIDGLVGFSPIVEPESLALFLLGILSLGMSRMRFVLSAVPDFCGQFRTGLRGYWRSRGW